MKILDSVKLANLQPQIIVALMVVEPIIQSHGQELIITCGSNGNHSSRNSKHHVGHAVDIRSWNIEDKEAFALELRSALTPEFYVKVESTHIHIQHNGSLI